MAPSIPPICLQGSAFAFRSRISLSMRPSAVSPLLQGHSGRTAPCSCVGPAGGGLEVSGGMALGLKLAEVRGVVQVAGDGAFHFCARDSVLCDIPA